jgi:hypothetical protein
VKEEAKEGGEEDGRHRRRRKRKIIPQTLNRMVNTF